jgi:hypothetical protein
MITGRNKRALSFIQFVIPRSFHASLLSVQCSEKDIDEISDWQKIQADQQPLIIRNVAKNWPAVSDSTRCWKSLNYLKITFGRSHVPVEVGGDYMNPETKHKTMTFAAALDHLHYLETSKSDDHYYIAQHHILAIDGMIKDVQIPEMCMTGYGKARNCNVWLGSAHTSSPCHRDPYENILVQVFGKKSVLLFSPDQSQHMCQHKTHQRNTSQIDFNAPDMATFPSISKLSGVHAELLPGDGLYIPYHWWHFCKSLSLNCSVNFWWV